MNEPNVELILQNVLAELAKINERLDSIERTINPQRWERLHPEFDGDITDESPF